MNRAGPIPTTPSRRGFLAVLGASTASVIAPAALASIPAPVAEIMRDMKALNGRARS